MSVAMRAPLRSPAGPVPSGGWRHYRPVSAVGEGEEAIKSKPDWVLITSWNEWHEGSEIEPSLEFDGKYVQLTFEFAPRFRAGKALR